jgi:hypothetical protein
MSQRLERMLGMRGGLGMLNIVLHVMSAMIGLGLLVFTVRIKPPNPT